MFGLTPGFKRPAEQSADFEAAQTLAKMIKGVLASLFIIQISHLVHAHTKASQQHQRKVTTAKTAVTATAVLIVEEVQSKMNMQQPQVQLLLPLQLLLLLQLLLIQLGLH